MQASGSVRLYVKGWNQAGVEAGTAAPSPRANASVQTVRRPATILYNASRTMAPSIDMIQPAPWLSP